MPSVTLDTVIASQMTLAEIRNKHEQYAKELGAAQRRLDRKTVELAQAEQTFAQVKAAFEGEAAKVPAKTK